MYTLLLRQLHRFECTDVITRTVQCARCMLLCQQDFESKNVKLVLANWKGPQRDMLERSGERY
jgi:hypothetical protein